MTMPAEPESITLTVSGNTPDAVTAAVDTVKRGKTWVYLNSTEDLRRSGRLSATTAMLPTNSSLPPTMDMIGLVARSAVDNMAVVAERRPERRKSSVELR